MLAFWKRPNPLERLRERFMHRTIIVHRGFPDDWFSELLKQPGGGGHFRLDARRLPTARPAPIEWMVQTHVQPLDLPHPLLIRIDEHHILIRHLMRNDHAVHPSEIGWFLEELDTRHHARLAWEGDGFRREAAGCIDVADNEPKSMFDAL
ncbi:MAG: hypothetical protein ACK4IT_10425 [Thioalkalivibrionaceae bacterium]